MVKGVGWWRTFGMVVVLGLRSRPPWSSHPPRRGRYRPGARSAAGVAVGLLLFLVFVILVPPYAICYVSVMYLGLRRRRRAVCSGGGTGAASRRRRRLRPPTVRGNFGTPPSYSMPPGPPCRRRRLEGCGRPARLSSAASVADAAHGSAGRGCRRRHGGHRGDAWPASPAARAAGSTGSAPAAAPHGSALRSPRVAGGPAPPASRVFGASSRRRECARPRQCHSPRGTRTVALPRSAHLRHRPRRQS